MMIKYRVSMMTVLFAFGMLCVVALVTRGAERDADAAAQAALGHSPDEVEESRPAHLPDLTKGEVIPPAKKGGIRSWNLGPTGIVGTPNAWYDGDQVQVLAVLPGSPAEGQIMPGDALLGVQGKKFNAGGHLGLDIGNAIIKAEEESGKGVLTLQIWRDLNWTKRGDPKDMLGVDIDELIAETEQAQLYEWAGEEERNVSVKSEKYDEFPIVGMYTNITLQLAVMGTYSATSPYNCPVATKIREEALKVVANEFIPSKDRRVRKRPSWPGVLALVASGKPEYIALAKKWVHSLDLTQDINLDTDLSDMSYRGMQSWRTGFEALEQAIYYDATGDEFILPEIRKNAIWAAMGQNGGGSWGHTFSFPEFNGGELHKRNPGYGGMNNAGTRCFFMLTLAKKFGIEHPEINDAIERAKRFFGTYTDKGCIPYGYHPPAASDDSNGKNYGATYAFYVLGDKYSAKYFSMCSANAAFSRRGGHGSPTLWYYTPFSSFVSGPKAIMMAMRNMRWFYTLARRHDGSFVFQGKQAGMGGKGMRNPTATHAMYYAVPLEQLIITGKDADKRFWLNDEDLEELIINARGQFTDPLLLKAAGKPWPERSTDELIGLLDSFMPKTRAAIASELGNRFKGGETDIVTKVMPLLSDPEARAREGACLTLSACGSDHVLANLSKITVLLDDPAEFVRMTAIKTMSNATDVKKPGPALELLLKAAVDNYEGRTMDHGNVRSAVKDALFGGKKLDPSVSELYSNPFNMGFDYDLVRSALANIVTLDPSGSMSANWTRDTVVELAGPLVYVASDMQLNDAMFAGARQAAGRALLDKYGYLESYEADTDILKRRALLDRDMRIGVEFLHGRKLNAMGYVTISKLKSNPAAYSEHLPAMIQWLQDEPLTVVKENNARTGWIQQTAWIGELVRMVQDNASTADPMPSLHDAVFKRYASELAALSGTKAKIEHCRSTLADPTRKDFFRKLAAMTHLKEMLGADALAELVAYFGHEQWRLREQTHEIAVDLVREGATDQLVTLLTAASGKQAAGMVAALADAGDRSALPAIQKALKHSDAVVRGEAVQALVQLAGDKALSTVFTFLETAKKHDDYAGAEKALLSRRDDAAFCKRVSEDAIARLAKSSVDGRRSLAWVLSQLGGAENLAAVQEAAAGAEDKEDIRNIVRALSFSPDRAADAVMLAVAKAGRPQLDAVADESIRRMIGPNGLKDRSDKDRVDFARSILQMKYSNPMIKYLAHVHTGRSVALLFEVMQSGKERLLTNLAASSIIGAADGMNNPPAEDAKIAADALAQVIEFIEVNYLRGGMMAHMEKEDNYLGWKDIQARAGKALLKVHKPEKAPIPTFDDMDLDF